MALRTTPPKVALIAGLHRSGTTLISRLLNSLPDVVALNEPMKVKNLQNLPDTDLFAAIEEFISSTRSGLISSHQAVSRHTDGYATDNYFPGTMAEIGLRKSVEKDGLVTFDKVLSDDFLLVIKHHSAFTAYLDRFFERFDRCLPPDKIIRYEDVIGTGGSCLKTITPSAVHLNENLESRNNNPLYKRDLLRKLSEKILSFNGSYWKFYSRQDVEIPAESGIS